MEFFIVGSSSDSPDHIYTDLMLRSVFFYPGFLFIKIPNPLNSVNFADGYAKYLKWQTTLEKVNGDNTNMHNTLGLYEEEHHH